MSGDVEHRTALGAHEMREAGGLAPAFGVAKRAVAAGAEPRVSRRVVENPWAKLERGPVAYVLRMAARELRHPVALLVAMEADDRPFQCAASVAVMLAMSRGEGGRYG